MPQKITKSVDNQLHGDLELSFYFQEPAKPPVHFNTYI